MEVLIEAAKSIPALAALIWIVYQNGRREAARDQQFLGHLEKRDAVLEKIEARHEKAQDGALEVIRENTRAQGSMEGALTAFKAIMDDLRQRAEK